MSRAVYVSRSQNLAALLDNVWGLLTSKEASGLMRAIDEAGDDGRRATDSARAYLAGIGVAVRETEVAQ